MWNFIWLQTDSSLQTNDSNWLNSSCDSTRQSHDSIRKIFRWLWLEKLATLTERKRIGHITGWNTSASHSMDHCRLACLYTTVFYLFFITFIRGILLVIYYLWKRHQWKINLCSQQVWLKIWPISSFAKSLWLNMSVRTWSSTCETWNFLCLYILNNMNLICGLWCYCFSFCCIGVISWFESQKCMNKQ